MHRLTIGLIAAISIVTNIANAQQSGGDADLRVRAGAAPPVYSWTGFYVGGNVGYSWGSARSNVTDPPPFNVIVPLSPRLVAATNPSGDLDPDGPIGGAQIGWNWQAANWVYGLEADFQWSGQKDSIAIQGGTFQMQTGGGNVISGSTSAALEARLKWFGTVRGRLGYAWNNILLYGTGGLAYGRVDVRGSGAINGQLFAGTPACVAIGTCSISAGVPFGAAETKAGWTLGAGIEIAPWANNWSWKFEYLYVDLGTISETLPYGGRSVDPTGVVTVTTSGSVTHDTRVTDHILRVGLNYRFR